MERRYLAATLALAATFAIFSREFRSGHLAKLPSSRAELRADIACAKHYLAEQLMAKLQPYVDRGAPEQAQIVAELNLPEVVRVEQKVADAQVQLARQAEQQKCAATIRAQHEAMRAEQAGERALEIRIRSVERAREIQDLAVVRAQELSERANERAQQINLAATIRAQEMAAKAMERAQCALQKSRSKMDHAQWPTAPIHISFQVPATPKIDIVVPAVPQPPAPANF